MSPTPRRQFWILLAAAAIVAAATIVMHRGAVPPASPAAEISSAVAAINPRETMAKTEPATDSFRAAVLLAFRETDPSQRSIAFGQAFATWFQHDREAALAWLRQMPPGGEYTQGMFLALQAIGKTDPLRALALAETMAATHEQRFIYNALFDQIAGKNLAAAVGDLRYIPSGEARENALRALTGNWITQDSAGALNWAAALTEPGDRAIAMESVLTALASTNPQQAADLAAQNLTGAALDRVLETSLKQMAVGDPQAAANAVSQLPAGELQKNAAINVARALTAEDPATALAWQQTLPADTQAMILNNILDVWLKQDAAAAGSYVSALPAGSNQDAAAAHLAGDWAASDASAAIAWAENLSSPSAQNAAIISLASGWARADAAAATQWAASLPADNAARPESMKGAFSYWEMADAAAANNYLQSLPGPDRALLNPGLATK